MANILEFNKEDCLHNDFICLSEIEFTHSNDMFGLIDDDADNGGYNIEVKVFKTGEEMLNACNSSYDNCKRNDDVSCARAVCQTAHFKSNRAPEITIFLTHDATIADYAHEALHATFRCAEYLDILIEDYKDLTVEEWIASSVGGITDNIEKILVEAQEKM